MENLKYKVGYMTLSDTGESYSAIYKLNKKGEWDYYFLVDNHEVGEKLLKTPDKIEKIYKRDRLLIGIFTIVPIIGLTIGFLYCVFN